MMLRTTKVFHHPVNIFKTMFKRPSVSKEILLIIALITIILIILFLSRRLLKPEIGIFNSDELHV